MPKTFFPGADSDDQPTGPAATDPPPSAEAESEKTKEETDDDDAATRIAGG
jgi:hypothetical protein